MPKYTRRHYKDIASTIADLPATERRKHYDMWSSKLKSDNSRFDPFRFGVASGMFSMRIQKRKKRR